ncbi:histidine kinase [Nocardioides sp.]|uniref:sensor histidine kinase n=1 Tax=Nocardioides sp. TaxID=35761 RepID=UPI00260FDD1E|nr:histidine kinase [Nocardioides sp.]
MPTRLRSLLRSIWTLPAPADARPAGRLDYAFVAVTAVAAVVEVAFLRPEMGSRLLTLATFLVWLPTLLVRRTNPTLTVAVFAGVMLVLGVAASTTDLRQPDDLNTAVVALLIPYSLARWASGRAAFTGLCLFLLVAGSSLVSQDLAPGDRVGGAAVVVAATAMGAVLRSRAMLRTRQLDDVRQLERESLARDLHDTVAHHLTAIAITAQAGLAVADDRPDAARDALRRIDDEATRTLAETRKVLRMLRTEAAEGGEAPDRPLDDLAGLASDEGRPRVEVHLDDGLELSPTVAAAVHRIAQEAVANARRHGVGTTLVRVAVNKNHSDIVLTVTDDGRPSTRSGQGFGILGMTERAELLGGRLEAGPATGGWQVTAVLPVGTEGVGR